MMRYGLVLALLLVTAPANAQTDEDSCIAAAERLDARTRAREQPTAQEKEAFETCIGEFNCEELAAAANAGNVPAEAVNTHAKGMRYTMRYCGNTSAAAQEPEPAKKAPEPPQKKREPEPPQPPADSAFGQPPKSMFSR